MALVPRELRKVGPKHDLVLAIGLHVLQQLCWIELWRIGRRINVDILVLPCHCNHLIRPGIANVSANDLEIRKVQCDPVDVRYRPPCVTGIERPGVSNLGHKRNIQLHAFCKDRVEVVGGRGHAPQPRYYPNSLKTFLFNVVLQLLDRRTRLRDVYRAYTDEAVGVLLHKGGNDIIGDDGSFWPVPRTHENAINSSSVHHGNRLINRHLKVCICSEALYPESAATLLCQFRHFGKTCKELASQRLCPHVNSHGVTVKGVRRTTT
mmetsp:Transcript_34694/g.80996  ORF Transcript_34694/g.80996 Transcript_34694/m.80996 type:complete len:264 (+) Transcript_34694:310-1101(+)